LEELVSNEVTISRDGVHENKSTSRSLEIFSIRFDDCCEIYPCFISKPEHTRKQEMSELIESHFESYLKGIVDAGLIIKKAVLDAPERAACRRQKMHGGYYSCDVCTANPENIPLPGGKRGCKLILFINFFNIK